jgi:branched-chain amino acid transport system permease protein
MQTFGCALYFEILRRAVMSLPWGQLIVNGLALGSLYALTAFGIVLIFKTTDVITFAQGESAMFCTFIAFTLLTAFQLPFPLAFVITLIFAASFGALMERVILRRIRATSIMNSIIVTVGLSLILLGTAGWIWGYEVRTFPAPVGDEPFRFGNIILSQLNALIFVVTLLLMVILFAFFRYTLTGIAMRAVAQNRVAAQLMGINTNRINAIGWGLGTTLAAVTGVLIAPLNYLDPTMMGDVVLKAFTAAVLGGFTSLPGAVVGGLVLGIIDSVVGFQVPELRTTFAFALIVLVLVVRPGGLLGKHEIKKV